MGVGISDAGRTYGTNTVSYNLNLRHTCGNGRVDIGEECDPEGPFGCFLGPCSNGVCSQFDALSCVTDADCGGSCLPAGDVNECICLF
jgi:hypothetical protein